MPWLLQHRGRRFVRWVLCPVFLAIATSPSVQSISPVVAKTESIGCADVLAPLDVPDALSSTEVMFREELLEACKLLQATTVSVQACRSMALAWKLLTLAHTFRDEIQHAEAVSCGHDSGRYRACAEGDCARDILWGLANDAGQAFAREVQTVFLEFPSPDENDWLATLVHRLGLDLANQVDANAASFFALLVNGTWSCGAYAHITQHLRRVLALSAQNFTLRTRSYFQAALIFSPSTETQNIFTSRRECILDWSTYHGDLISSGGPADFTLLPHQQRLEMLANSDCSQHLESIENCLHEDEQALNLSPHSTSPPIWTSNSKTWSNLTFGATVEDGLFHGHDGAVNSEALIVGISQHGGNLGVLTSPRLSYAEHGRRLAGGHPPAFGFASPRKAFASHSKLKLYVHQVPQCGGTTLLSDTIQAGQHANDWRRVLAQTAQHMYAVHEALLHVSALVATPEDASLMYIPAFFKILIELYAGAGNAVHLNCIVDTWRGLNQTVLLRRAGYDHILVGNRGTMCESFECDIGNYHPALQNMISLVAGEPSYGHPEKLLFNPGSGIWPWLQKVFVPLGTSKLNCSDFDIALDAPRDVAIALVCSANSRVRNIIKDVVEDTAQPFSSDPRIQIHVSDGTQHVFDAMNSDALWSLYRRSVWCLVVPGNLQDLTYRFYDAIRLGCLPVIVSLPPLIMSIPFAHYVDFASFSHFAHVDDSRSVTVLLDNLLAAAFGGDSSDLEARRFALRNAAPSLFFEHVRCATPQLPSGSNSGWRRPFHSAGDLMAAELLMRHEALSHLRFTGVLPTI